MPRKFPFTDDGSRYHTLKYHNRRTYGKPVYKAVVDAGFTCPNIDGKCGTGGCIYCSGGSGYFTQPALSVAQQIQRETERIRATHTGAGVIAYFQAHSNTYCGMERLRQVYSEALSCDICGISIATRADCIDREKAEYLASLPLPVTVELGLQTAHDSTAGIINRGHSFADFVEGYNIVRKAGLRVCVHIINGLPGETPVMMLQTAEILGKMRPDGVKIHLLHVIKNTRLAEMYLAGNYTPLTMQQYIDITVKQLELLPPETVIERLTGDGDKKTLLAPLWSLNKRAVLGGIMKRQKELDSIQGMLFQGDI
ncbi:MAG: TIGR01212 family radical SAM protein [Oscillospiraceae bacterium]